MDVGPPWHEPKVAKPTASAKDVGPHAPTRAQDKHGAAAWQPDVKVDVTPAVTANGVDAAANAVVGARARRPRQRKAERQQQRCCRAHVL